MPEQRKAGDVNYLAKHGVRAAENGWPLVLLRYKDKRPLDYPWVKTDITLKKVKSLVAQGKKYGIGIKCGNVVGLDDDYEEGDAVTKDFLKAVSDLKDHYFPETLHRKGRGSRPPLRAFRLAGEETIKSANIGKLQIIGVGRQFVAYNTHPETGEPYQWLKTGVGSPATMKLDDVPTYTKKELLAFINAMQLLEDAYGLSPENASSILERLKSGDFKPGELRGDKDVVTRACSFLENKAEWGWEEWNRNIMMPLWGASGGEDWGLELAHAVSSQHELYDKDATDERWHALTKSPPTRIGAGTLYWQARLNGMPFIGPRSWDQFKVFLDREEVLNVQTDSWMKKSTFNDFFNAQKEKGSTPLQTFMSSRPEQCYDTVIWDPALPPGVQEQGNRRVYNTCVMPDTFGEQGDVGPWLEVMDNVYGKHEETMIKRMAFDVQYPHLKPQWHELIIGEHGVGKNLTKMPLHTWFGEMARSLNASALESQFTGFMARKKHLEIVELASISSKVFNKHKDLLATSDLWYEVNEKFMRPYRVKNVVSVWMSSNEIDALSISPTERRIFVVHKKDKALPKKLLVKVFNWIRDENGWKYVIYYLKHKVKVDKTFGDLLPYRTEAMQELVRTAGRAHDRLREQVRAVTKNCTVFGLPELHQHFVEAGVCEKPGYLVHIETIRKTLISEGAVRCAGGQPIRLSEGEQKRLWSFETELAEADPDEVRGHWLASGSFKDIVTD